MRDGVVGKVFDERADRLAIVREVFGQLKTRIATVEVSFTVLVHGIERGIFRCRSRFKLRCPLV